MFFKILLTLMAGLKGLVSMVAELRAERTNLVSQLKHIDTALSDSHSVGDATKMTAK
jgi:hypothetical protein